MTNLEKFLDADANEKKRNNWIEKELKSLPAGKKYWMQEQVN